MKKTILSTALFLFSALATFAQKSTDNLAGNWKTPQGKVIMINSTVNSTFNGTVKDKNIMVLKDVKFSGGKWKGQLIKPDDGSKINCEVLLDGDKLRLTAKKGPFSKEIIWRKTQ